MKKVILFIAFVFLSGNVFSQEDTFRNDIKKLMAHNTSIKSLKTSSAKKTVQKTKLSKTDLLENEVLEKSIKYVKKNFTHQEIKNISKEINSNTIRYSKKANQFLHYWRITQAELKNKKRALIKK